MSKDSWKAHVKKNVESFWFSFLVQECGCSKKTHLLKYDVLSCQDYLVNMPPGDAQIIFRARTRSISCKGNMSSSHRANMLCRLCGESEETQEHVLNCPVIKENRHDIDIEMVYDLQSADPAAIDELCSRVRLFDDMIIRAS